MQVMRNITTHSEKLSQSELAWAVRMSEQVANIKTYVHRTFGGTGNLHNLQLSKARRILKKRGTEVELSKGMPKHMYDIALKRSLAELKTEWARLIKEVKSELRRHAKLSKLEMDYAYIIFSRKEFLSGLFNKDVPSPTISLLKEVAERERLAREAKGIDKKTGLDNFLAREDLNQLTQDRAKYIWSSIRRRVRELKTNSSNRTIAPSVIYVDSTIASWEGKTLKISRGLDPETGSRQERIQVQIKGSLQGRMKETVIRVDKVFSRLEAYKPVPVRQESKERLSNSAIGVDKGYRDLLITSNGTSYGVGYRKSVIPKLLILSEKQSRRQKYWAKYRLLLKSGKTDKAQRILENNLGLGRWSKLTGSHSAHKRSLINHSLNDLFSDEEFNQIVVEDLSRNFKRSNKKVSLSRQMRGELSQWDKGYLQERIAFKAYQLRVDVTLINPAYTSQQCHKCDKLGNRKLKVFTCTNPSCNVDAYDADINAAKTILKRKDANIELWMRPEAVKAIIEAL